MTIQFPNPNFADKLLSWIGKKRAIRLPLEVYKKYGPYAYAQAEKESFWRAVMRPRGKEPPEGWIYWDEVKEKEEKK